MTGYRDFIVEIEVKNEDKITTKSGSIIHLDKRWNQKETASNIVKVVSVPLGYKGPIKKGFNLFVDPTIFFQQTYEKGGKMESTDLIDREKGLYKVAPSLIICYSEGEATLWEGYNDNVIIYKSIELEPEPLKKIGSIIIPETSKEKVSINTYRTIIINELLKDVINGEEVIINEQMAVDVYMRGEKYTWVRNKDILAVIENNNAA